MNLAPLVFLGFIIFFMIMSAKVRKQAEEARRAAQNLKQEQNEPAAAQPKPSVPARETPRAAAASSTQTGKDRVSAKRPQTKGETVKPTVKTDSRENVSNYYSTEKPKKQTTATENEKEEKNPIVNWSQTSAMQGIVMAEILGKPKALRKNK